MRGLKKKWRPEQRVKKEIKKIGSLERHEEEMSQKEGGVQKFGKCLLDLVESR